MKQYTRYIFTVLLAGLSGLQATAQQVANPADNKPDGSTLNPGTVSYPGLNDLVQPANFNYIRTTVPDIPSPNLPSTYVRRTTTFFDGLGRPLQTVAQKAMDDTSDLVQHHVYDSVGRESTQYLSYRYGFGSPTNAQAGKFHRLAKTDLSNFYSGSPGEHPYSKTEFENSALARPTKQLSPGKNWIGTGRGVATSYGTNNLWVYTQGSPPVGIGITSGYPRWTIAAAAGSLPQYQGSYALGELFRTRTQDEDGKIAEEFKDKQGRVVFTRSLINTANAANPAPGDYAYTCYVYDDLGRLRCVIPPTASMTGGIGTPQVTWSMDQQRLDGMCYQYTYDERSRKIGQKLPGKGWEEFVYDKRDRQVMYQDPFLKGQNKWFITFYDALDRQTVTSIIITSSNRQTLANAVNDTSTWANNSFLYYIKNYSLMYAYPASYLGGTMLSYTYYDNYSQAGNLTYDATQFDGIGMPADGTVMPSVPDTILTRGRVTGSKVRIMDPENPTADNWITTANYYDRRGRLIQSKSTNNKGGIDISSNIYYFQGMPWKNILREENPSAKPIPGSDTAYKTFKLVTTSTASLSSGGGSDRVKSVSININNNFEYPLANYFYDHMGRVVVKQTAAANVLQEYNVRGFLNHIHVVDSNNIADSIHIFEENLYYDWGFASKLYNGNIAGITWRQAGSAADTQAYGYSYDGLNRLNHAQYNRKAGSSGWVNSSFNYTASNITYDKNGNIQSMNQMGPVNGAPATMDQLTYTYAANSNQLIKVEDAIAPATTASLPDFKNNANTATEYTYDGNGNMSSDANKQITSINYNHLNKPIEINVLNQGYILYTYDASGNRLRKKVHTNATNHDDIYDYIGNFVYKNDTLQYILSSEGRARPILDTFNHTRFVYDYFIKDHLGNVRSTVTAEPMNLAYIASHEIAMAGTEQLIFDNIPNVRDSKPGGGGGDVMAVRLNGGESDKRIGTAIMLHAMPGDRFTVSADAFYEGSYQQSTEEVGSDAIVQSLAAALMGGTTYEGVPVSELPDNAKLAGSILGNPSLPTTLSTLVDQTNNPDAPKAHLNILFFDENMRLIPQASSITQVTQNNLNNANGWTVLTPTGTGGGPHPGAPGPGYVVIYVDNQSIGKDVWFDNIMVGHYTGTVQEESHYYPFGLTLQTDVQTPEVTKQPYKLTTKELEESFNLNLYNFGARMQDETIGRWLGIDPLASRYVSLSPYSYCANNPTMFIDPNGKEIWIYQDKDTKFLYKDGKLYTDSKGEKEYTGKISGFTKRVVKALDKLSKGSEIAKSMISELMDSNNEFNIQTSDNNPNEKHRNQSEFYAKVPAKAIGQLIDPNSATAKGYKERGMDISGGSGGDIYWNVNGAEVPTENGFARNSTTDLAHEMAHGLDANRGLLDGQFQEGTEVPKKELQAAYRENLIRQQMQLPLRTYYNVEVNEEGTYRRVSGPRLIDDKKQPILPPGYKL